MPKSFIQAVRNRKLHLLYGTAVGVLLSIGATERVLAACVVTPGPGFSDGADVGNCTGASGFIDASGGNDIVTLHQAGNASDIALGSGNDTVTVNGGSVNNRILGGLDNDLIIVTSGTVREDIFGQEGNDIIVMQAGRVGDDILGNDGNDFITIAGGSVDGEVAGGSGNDTVTMSGGVIGSAGQGIRGEEGDDTLIVDGIANVEDQINGAVGNDQITFGGLAQAEQLVGGDGDDHIVMTGGFLQSAGEKIVGGSGNDSITVLGSGLASDVNGDITGGSGNDNITVVNTSDGDAFVGGAVRGDGGNDTLVVGVSVNQNVRGDAGDDTLILISGANVANGVNAGSGNDVITIAAGSFGNAIFGEEGNDIISIAGGTISNQVLGGTGNDTISMSGGQVATNVIGEDGNDILVLNGGSVGGNFQGNSGDDFISLGGGDVNQDVEGNDGNDSIVMTGGTVSDDVEGNSGNDQITMTGGGIGDDLSGNAGNDTITVAGGSIGDEVRGADGNDTISIAGGSLGDDVEGNAGDDQIFISGGAIALDVEGGTGADSIYVTGGSMQDIFGGGNNDIIEISGLADASSDTIGGDGGDDTISLHGGEISGAEVLGGSGNDTFDVSGAGGSDYLRSVTELFGGSGTNDVAIFTGFDGVLSEEFGGFEQVLLLNGTVLNVYNPNSITPDDRDLSAGATPLVANVLYVDPTSTLLAAGNSPGNFTWSGNQANEGLSTMIDNAADDTYTVTGNYAGGSTGQLGVDAALDASEDGDIFVFGNVADVDVAPPVPGAPRTVSEGSTAVIVNDIGNGIGQLTGHNAGDGIAVIDVSGTGNTDDNDFFLPGGPIQSGAVEYDLALESDGIWYLQSDFLDQVFGYAAAPSAILNMARDYMGDLHKRVGSREQTWSGGATQISDGSGVWLRSGGFFGKVDGDTSFPELDYSQNHYFAQVGADFSVLSDDSAGHLIAGVMGHAGYSETQQDERGNIEMTTNNIHAYGGGLSLTYYGGQGEGWIGEGLYVDGVAQVTFYELETKTASEGTRGETDGWGWSIGIESGYSFNVGGDRDGPRLTPQIQLVYSAISLDDFTDEEGVIVEFDNADSLEGRIGLAVDSGKMWRSVNAYAEANIVHEFLGDTEVTVTTLPVDFDLGGTAAELGMGGTVSLLDNVNLYADVDYRLPFDNGRQGASVIGGVRLSF